MAAMQSIPVSNSDSGADYLVYVADYGGALIRFFKIVLEYHGIIDMGPIKISKSGTSATKFCTISG